MAVTSFSVGPVSVCGVNPPSVDDFKCSVNQQVAYGTYTSGLQALTPGAALSLSCLHLMSLMGTAENLTGQQGAPQTVAALPAPASVELGWLGS